MNTVANKLVPIERREPPPRPPARPSFRRLLRALLIERRLPYRLELAWNKILAALGVTHKTIQLNGMRFQVRRLAWDEGFLRHAIEREDYSKQDFALRENDTVVDVGANIGAFAVYAAKHASRGRVIAFEPASDNFELLARNAALNGLANLTPVRAAVSGKTGTLTLFRASGSGAHSTTAGRLAVTTGTETVEAFSLADVFQRYGIEHCNLLKLNCEGAEFEILYSATGAILARIDRIAMEYHATQDKRQRADELIAHLSRHGFEVAEYVDYVDLDCGFLSVKRTTAERR